MSCATSILATATAASVRCCGGAAGSDNGPEFIANAAKEWLARSGVKTVYIEPAALGRTRSASFNSRFEDELLNREIFTSLEQAKVIVEQYRVSYNHEWPHSWRGYMTPAEFAESTTETTNLASAPEGATAFDHAGQGCLDTDRDAVTALS